MKSVYALKILIASRLGRLVAGSSALMIWLTAPEHCDAYVGPGAGFAVVGSFLTLLLAFGAGTLTLLIWPIRNSVRWYRRRKIMRHARVRRVIVLGLDGLDPDLTERWMGDGELPHLNALAKMGSFSRLRTTYPAISPVAWSSFMTGVDPARHNIFDFLDRDLRTYRPRLSSSRVETADPVIRIGRWLIPLRKPIVRNMRKSRAFWSILGDNGVPSNILRVPLTFPPEKFAGMLLAGMCVPDLRGTQGSFSYYTTAPEEVGGDGESTGMAGGERHLVRVEDDMVQARLFGPDDSMRPDRKRLELPFVIQLFKDKKEAMLRIAGQRYHLKEREYSPWIRFSFKPVPGVQIRGIARFYITRIEPEFGLYVTPINIDPGKPALGISWPFYYSVYLSKLIGSFATLGLAEDTWALNERIIDEDAFLQQTMDYHHEREAMFFNALEKSNEGVIACVFDGTDRLQHMFFRYLDESHPANHGKDQKKHRTAILGMYKRIDDMVGRVVPELGPRDLLVVMSDHGFQSFRRGVNLNSWLVQEGFLRLKDMGKESGDWFDNVDWTSSKAYAFGLGGIYINQKGREARGTVMPGEATQALKRELIERLSGLYDTECRRTAINEVFDCEKIYSTGPYLENGPDLIVGYSQGYRASWEGAVGRPTNSVFNNNTKSWSGDHCIDPRLVPGVLFSNWPIISSDPGISDLAPTILKLFGVAVPKHITGKPLDVVQTDTTVPERDAA